MAAMRDFHRHAGIGQLDVDDSKMTKSTAQSHTHTLQIWKAGTECRLLELLGRIWWMPIPAPTVSAGTTGR